MGDAINLFKLLLEYFGGNLATNITLLFLAVLLPIKIHRIRHPRYRSRYITLIILLLVVLNAILNDLISLENWWVLCAVLSLLVFYAIFSYFAAKKPIGYSKLKLGQLKEIVQQGYSWNHEELFNKRPFYFIDFVERFEFDMLHAEHLGELGKIKEAYELYNQVDERKLFLSEKNVLHRKKAFLLYELGDLNKAKYYLDNLTEKNDPNYHMLKGMVYENWLDLDRAAEHFQHALNMVDGKDRILEAMIYNNYGRLRFIEGNYTDAINYYRLSCEIAKQQKSKTLLHVSYQNLIHLCIRQKRVEESEQRLDEYSELIDSNVLKDLQEFYNLQMEVARQKSNKMNLIRAVDFGEIEIRKKLSFKQQLLFDINDLRLRCNNRLDLTKVLKRIYNSLNDYFNLEMPQRYFCMKEINVALSEIRFPAHHPYEMIRHTVLKYLKNEALKDLEHYLQILKDYEIKERCQIEREKIGVLQAFHKPYEFNRIYESMCDVKDIYNKNGLLIDMVKQDLDIADECFAIDNMNGSKIKAEPLEKMKKHVQIAEDNLAKLNSYPIVVEMYIKLSKYYFTLGNWEKSKEHLDAFKSSGVSIHHFAHWIQQDFHLLNSNFNPITSET